MTRLPSRVHLYATVLMFRVDGVKLVSRAGGAPDHVGLLLEELHELLEEGDDLAAARLVPAFTRV